MLAFPASLLSAGTVLAESSDDIPESGLSSGPEVLSSISGQYESGTPDFTTESEDGPEPFEDNEKVRVVVEVEGTPGLTYATQRGVQYSSLPEQTREELENDAVQAQESVQNRIQNANIEADILESFTTVVNGFSAEVPYGQLKRLENLAGVLNVEIVNEYERPELEEPDMTGSVEQIKAAKAWEEYGTVGENMVVGIIDSGVDPTHKDMVISDGIETALEESSLEGEDLPGKYFSEKVPYGYNYFDHNDEILETGNTASQHGMHVAGTVAANGDVDEGGIKGVAPEAQLLALKVFGNDPNLQTTYGDIYVAAMDDAVKLGVDVLNLSLGSGAGFVNPESHEQKAVQRMKENGVVVSISAGNSSHFGSGALNPLAANPDTGVVGSPSVSDASLSVASTENDFSSAEVMGWQAGEFGGSAPYLLADNDPVEVFDGEVELTYAGHGTPEELENAGVEGTVAVVSRGMYPGGDDFYAAFTEKAKAAQAAGAIGVIVHNNADSGFVSMQMEDSIEIPYLFILQDSGTAIAEASEAGETITANFTGETISVPSATQGELSSFSSWGLTPDLDFKPEITAPGGNIYSTQQDNGYGLMSGTSMAAPHVSGGSALVLDRVDEEFGVDGAERSALAKRILMNTAVPVIDKGTVNSAYELENYYSPRAQGAGEMDLYAALSTPAMVSSPADEDEGKVALRDFADFTEFQLEVENFSDEEQLYFIETSVQTDLAFGEQLGYTADLLEAAALTNVDFTAPEYVVVPAGETVSVDFSLDLTDAQVQYLNEETELENRDPDEVFENGYFVDGFVEFVDPMDNNPSMSVPFAGFNGEWDDAPIVDAERNTEGSFYDQTGLLFEEFTEIMPGTGIGTDELYHMPKLDVPAIGEGVRLYSADWMNGMSAAISLLRNAKQAEFNILNADGEVVRTLRNETDLRKSYFDQGRAASVEIFDQAEWDATIDGELAEDGQYSYEVRTVIDYDGAEWQSTKFDFHLDNTAPELEYDYDKENHEVSWTATDNYSGILGTEIHVDGELFETVMADGEMTQSESLEIPEDAERVQLFTLDYAENVSEEVINLVDFYDHEDIVVSIAEPGALSAYTSHQIPVSGTLQTDADIVSVTAAGQEVPFEYDTASNAYSFNGTITVAEDAVHDIQVVATDAEGNQASGNRQIIVDTVDPVIEHNAPSITAQDSIDVTFNLKDNYDEIRFYLNDSELYLSEFTSPYEKRALDTEVTETLTLSEGENTFTVRAVDVAGREVIEEVVINHDPSYEAVSRLSGETRFSTAVSISQEGWESSDTVFIANGLEFADALAGVPLAEEMDAPVLLSREDSIDPVVVEEIERLGASKAVILGGPNTVSAEVEAGLDQLGLSVERLSGDTRFDTAQVIADRLNEMTESNTAVLTNGLEFADALSIAPFAATEDMPIYLTRGGELEEDISAALAEYDHVYVIGGPNAVSDEAFNALPVNATRLAGDTRFTTNLSIFEHFGTESEELYVATGMNFADALTGSVLAAENNSGVALVRDEVTDNLQAFLDENTFKEFTLFGGENAVSNEIENSLIEHLNN